LIHAKKGGQFYKETDRPGKSENLFQVAALPYRALNLSLARSERLIDRHLAGQGSSNVLAHLLADRLKLRYSDKLYADLGNLLKRRVRRIGGLHRLEGHRSNANGRFTLE
jgi:hypothetical protein